MTHPIIKANICLFSGITNLGSEEKRKERKNKSSVITIGHSYFHPN